MAEAKPDDPEIDWSLTTWEGSRREQLRRWAELPLERMLMALEEMHDLSEQLGSSGKTTTKLKLRRSGEG